MSGLKSTSVIENTSGYFVLFLVLCAIAVYWLILHFISRRVKFFDELKDFAAKSLKPRVWIRFMLQSYLNFLNLSIGYLSLSRSFKQPL